MPGFGSGPFGGGPGGFGEYDWSRTALFLNAPEPYRVEDANQGNVFLKYSQGQAEVFDLLRRKIRDFGNLRDPWLVRTDFNEERFVVLGRQVESKDHVEQSGVEGIVLVNTQFQAVRARFREEDVGKLLFVENSNIAGNNSVVKISSILDNNTIATEPSLVQDAGPLRWSVRSEKESSEISFEISSGDVEPVYPGWFLSDGKVRLEVTSRRQFATDGTHTQQTSQEGLDGTISAGVFSSASARFTQADVGKAFTISGSSFHENNVITEIVEVLTSTTVTLTNTGLLTDAGPLVWAVRKRAVLTLSNDAALTGFPLQTGSNASTVAPSTIVAPAARFAAENVGGLIRILGEGSANNGTYVIDTVVDATTVTVTSATLLTETGPFLWEVRDPTSLTDPSTVRLFAPGLIDYLAEDFGISIDRRDSEEFQRRWVASVPRWMNRKAEEAAYVYLGRLAGFEITVMRLYRISQDGWENNSSLNTYLVGEEGAGRSGTGDGTLTQVGSFVHFTSPSALFAMQDENRQIEVTGSAGGSNDGLRTIETYVSPTEVIFRASETMLGTSEGSLDWRVVRIYATNEPRLPVYDEIDVNLMEYLKTPVITQSGTAGELVAPNVFSDASASFTSGDVNRTISIVGTANNGEFGILSVVDGTTLELDGSFTFPEPATGSIVWDILDPVFTIDKPCYDPYWSTLIGDGDGYLEITGTDPSTSSAFPVSVDVEFVGDANVAVGLGEGRWKLIDSSSSEYFLETVPQENAGTSGANGSLSLAGSYRLNAPGAGFVAADQFKYIRITDSGSGNDGLYSISAVIDPDNVSFRLDTVFSLPEANNGSVGWSVITFKASVVSTVPPAVGLATLEYLCPLSTDSCDFCASNKLLVEGTTPFLLDDPFQQLFDRLDEGRPLPVEFVSKVGQTAGGGIIITGGGSTP